MLVCLFVISIMGCFFLVKCVIVGGFKACVCSREKNRFQSNTQIHVMTRCVVVFSLSLVSVPSVHVLSIKSENEISTGRQLEGMRFEKKIPGEIDQKSALKWPILVMFFSSL